MIHDGSKHKGASPGRMHHMQSACLTEWKVDKVTSFWGMTEYYNATRPSICNCRPMLKRIWNFFFWVQCRARVVWRKANQTNTTDAPRWEVKKWNAVLRPLHLAPWKYFQVITSFGSKCEHVHAKERLFFSCIAGRVRDMVGQLLEIRLEMKTN